VVIDRIDNFTRFYTGMQERGRWAWLRSWVTVPRPQRPSPRTPAPVTLPSTGTLRRVA
jgi:hypothetical protein